MDDEKPRITIDLGLLLHYGWEPQEITDMILKPKNEVLKAHDASIARQARIDECRRFQSRRFGLSEKEMCNADYYCESRIKELSSEAGNAGKEKVQLEVGNVSLSPSAPEASECKVCNGQGYLVVDKWIDEDCWACEGTGKKGEVSAGIGTSGNLTDGKRESPTQNSPSNPTPSKPNPAQEKDDEKDFDIWARQYFDEWGKMPSSEKKRFKDCFLDARSTKVLTPALISQAANNKEVQAAVCEKLAEDYDVHPLKGPSFEIDKERQISPSINQWKKAFKEIAKRLLERVKKE